LVGWQHPFYTAFFGISLAIARNSGNQLLRIVAPFLGLGAAMITHSIHNYLTTIMLGAKGILARTFFDWSGWFFMLLFIIWAIRREAKWITFYLGEEINLGIISPEQYWTGQSSNRQAIAQVKSLFSGNYKNTKIFTRPVENLHIRSGNL
jgi:hypothetical protein